LAGYLISLLCIHLLILPNNAPHLLQSTEGTEETCLGFALCKETPVKGVSACILGSLVGDGAGIVRVVFFIARDIVLAVNGANRRSVDDLEFGWAKLAWTV
jgi:hypothetical protein